MYISAQPQELIQGSIMSAVMEAVRGCDHNDSTSGLKNLDIIR